MTALFTPKPYASLVMEFFEEIDLDPCWREGSPVRAATKYVRPQKNGLVDRWCGRVFVNPPWGYDWSTTGGTLRPWLRRCVDFRRGCESLAYVPSAPHTHYWRDLVFPHATAIAFVNDEPSIARFMNADGLEEPINVAFIYYGVWKHRFREMFGQRWPIVVPT